MGRYSHRARGNDAMHKISYLALVMVGLWASPLLTMAQDSKPTNKPDAAKPRATESGGAAAGAPKEASATPATPPGSDAETGKGSPQNEGGAGGAAESGTGAPPPPAVAGGTSPGQQGTYTVRLRDLEDRINRLKEQIFRSKARLSLLAETVLDRKIAGSKAVIVFKNEMGGSFRLVKATFLLDGGPIFNKSDEGGNLAERDVISLYDGPVMPGEHTLSAVLHYRGHGYGIFSYLRGYSFKTRSSRTFTVNEGKAMKLEVVGYEKGGVTTPLEDRPDVRYIMNVSEYDSDAQREDAVRAAAQEDEKE
jgi:hypothetical protein